MTNTTSLSEQSSYEPYPSRHQVQCLFAFKKNTSTFKWTPQQQVHSAFSVNRLTKWQHDFCHLCHWIWWASGRRNTLQRPPATTFKSQSRSHYCLRFEPLRIFIPQHSKMRVPFCFYLADVNQIWKTSSAVSFPFHLTRKHLWMLNAFSLSSMVSPHHKRPMPP